MISFGPYIAETGFLTVKTNVIFWSLHCWDWVPHSQNKCYLLVLTLLRLGSSQSKQMFSFGPYIAETGFLTVKTNVIFWSLHCWDWVPHSQNKCYLLVLTLLRLGSSVKTNVLFWSLHCWDWVPHSQNKCYLLVLTLLRLGSSQSKQMFSFDKITQLLLGPWLGLQFKKNSQKKQNLPKFLLTSNANNKVHL